MRRAILVLILITGCGTTGNNRRGPKPAPGTFDVTHRVLNSGLMEEGDLASVEVRITNGTKKYILLRKLVPADDSPAISWQEALGGKIEYIVGTDTYLYHEAKQDVTEAIFNSGLLCPGESVVMRLRIRVLAMPKGFTLHYQTYTLDGIPRDIMFGSPYRENVWRFRPLVGLDLRKKLTPIAARDKVSHRRVLFPHYMSREAETRVVAIDVPHTPRAFTLQEAGRKIGVTGGDTRWTFFSTLECWVIQKNEGRTAKAWLVSRNEVEEIAPSRRPGAFFQFLDSVDGRKIEVEFRDETKTVFKEDYKMVKALRRGSFRWICFVPRNEWLKLLRKVKEYGLVVDVDSDATGTRVVIVRNLKG